MSANLESSLLRWLPAKRPCPICRRKVAVIGLPQHIAHRHPGKTATLRAAESKPTATKEFHS